MNDLWETYISDDIEEDSSSKKLQISTLEC